MTREFEVIRKDWYKFGFEKGSMMELAYWTMWANRWAKLNEVKEWAAKRMDTREKYAGKKESWYGKKNEAIKVLASSGFGKLSFYRPADPDKIHVYFCDHHFEEFREERSYGIYERVMDAYWCNPKKYERCPDCTVEKEHDYYSLYFLEIGDDECRFSFHTPFPIGKNFLPSKKVIPSIEQEEDEGMFRFGRPLNPEEVVTHTEKLVEKKLGEALEQAKKYIPEDFHFDTLGKDDKPEEFLPAKEELPEDDSINEEEVFVIKKPKKKKKKNKGAKDAAGHHVIVKLLDGTDSEGNPISGYCIVDGKTDEIIPFDGNFRENSQDVIAEWNQLRGFERGDVWNLWRYRTQDGHFVEVLPSSKAEEILRKAGNSMNLSKFRFVLLDKETGAFVRGYQVKRRHQAVQRWKSEHQRQADAAIKKWAFSQKSFMDAVFNASNEAKHHGEILRESGLSKILKNFPEAKLGFPVPLERFLKWLRRYELAVAISRKHSAKQEPASQE